MLQTETGKQVELKDTKSENRILVLQILLNLSAQQEFLKVKDAIEVTEI